MMGSCAFLMPVGSVRFIRTGCYSLRTTLGLGLAGVPAVLIAASALAVAAGAPGAREQGGAWGSFTLGALVAACWVLGYALRTRRDYVATRREYVAELRDRAARLEAWGLGVGLVAWG